MGFETPYQKSTKYNELQLTLQALHFQICCLWPQVNSPVAQHKLQLSGIKNLRNKYKKSLRKKFSPPESLWCIVKQSDKDCKFDCKISVEVSDEGKEVPTAVSIYNHVTHNFRAQHRPIPRYA